MSDAHITFKPKQVTKRLLEALQPRARDVLTQRYGLGRNTTQSTLEAIGKSYDITRERVRQIDNHAINAIRKSEAYAKEKEAFDELKKTIDDMGGVVVEQYLLETLAKDKSTQNHIHFLLTVGEQFAFRKSTNEFHERWTIDPEFATSIESTLLSLAQTLNKDMLIIEGELVKQFVHELQDTSPNAQVYAPQWLLITKLLGRNPLGEWGLASSSNVRAKGMRDYAYLAIKNHGSPMHFREVAKSIERLFKKRAHEATCHNELIKDSRFVLVGRGLYALSEWGYTEGVVKDVICNIIRKHGPLTRSKIIDHVRNERYVKDNTILVNLQDGSTFKRNSDGTYTLVQ